MPALVAGKAVILPPPPTPPAPDLVASEVATLIQSKFKPDQMKSAFQFLDANRNGTLVRSEMKRTLALWGAMLTDVEYKQLFDACDKDKSGTIDYTEFCEMVAQNPEMSNTRTLSKNPALRPGVRAEDMRKAQHLVKQQFLTKFRHFTKAFKFIDRDRTGTISRDELKLVIEEFHLSNIRPEVLENLIDFIDIDAGNGIEYKEFARVLTADDVMEMAPLRAQPAPVQRSKGIGRNKMEWMPNAQGMSWTNTAMK